MVNFTTGGQLLYDLTLSAAGSGAVNVTVTVFSLSGDVIRSRYRGKQAAGEYT